MTLILNGTDNSATTPAVTGTDTDTGVFFPAANVLAFATNGTEDARFDASGNLLIGQSVDNFPGAGNTVTGGGITASGRISFSAASATVAYLNRNTDNGELLSFRRQGTGVGAVNATTAGITVTGTNGITFTATQTASADANTLDDYEEGSWTPTFFTLTNGNGTNLGNGTGNYVKIGNIVTLNFYRTPGGANALSITGVPFAPSGDKFSGVTSDGAFLSNDGGTIINYRGATGEPQYSRGTVTYITS
jgi:hypothetical protein